MAELKPRLGKYAVWGNHDYEDGGSAVYPALMTSSGFILLANTPQQVDAGNGRTLWLDGIGDGFFGTPDLVCPTPDDHRRAFPCCWRMSRHLSDTYRLTEAT